MDQSPSNTENNLNSSNVNDAEQGAPSAQTPPPAIPSTAGWDSVERERLIATAVKFLQNTSVANSSFKEKQNFLQKKGLTTDEISYALIQAQQELNTSHQVAVPPSRLSSLRNWTVFLAMFGGAAYAFYKFYKEFVLPFLKGEDEEETESMQKTLSQQTEALTLVKGALKIDQMQTSTGARNDIKEIKEELSSLKRLLLNRHQFPETPVSKPVIPSWQLAMEVTESPVGKFETCNSPPTPSSESASPNSTGNTDTGANDGGGVMSSSVQEVSNSTENGEITGQADVTEELSGKDIYKLADSRVEVIGSPDVVQSAS
ncbi:hypothetical protein EB796_017879 [Bugula neritina]|uniref:Peroxisomal membrane protein PEX14 n=1 Tax=Bugula neritina TaxID=10212 RepID=A0A7J7JC23_BUGNE|nr:hypothetical protein EB796_017879 [Bugula neritina]